MARATVNMVLRTTGFANRPPLLDVPQPKRPRSTSPHERADSNASLSQFESKPGQKAYISTSSGERVPAYRAPEGRFQLDPNIRDLFPEDTPETQRFRTVRWGAGNPKNYNKNGGQIVNRDVLQHRQTPMHSPASPAVSVETNGPLAGDLIVDLPSKESFQLPTTRETRAVTHQTTTSTSSTRMPSTPNSYSTYNLDSNTPVTPMGPSASLHTPHGNTLQPLPSFQNGVPFSALVEPGYHSQNQSAAPDLSAYHSELDYLLGQQSATAMSGAYMATSGLSLGFNADDHDWNDGLGPDLLDGYWFRQGWGGTGSISGGSGLNALIPGISGQEMGMGMIGGWGMSGAGGGGGSMQQNCWGQQGDNLMPPPPHSQPAVYQNQNQHQHQQQSQAPHHEMGDWKG